MEANDLGHVAVAVVIVMVVVVTTGSCLSVQSLDPTLAERQQSAIDPTIAKRTAIANDQKFGPHPIFTLWPRREMDQSEINVILYFF
jgi:hypothetical protein